MAISRRAVLAGLGAAAASSALKGTAAVPGPFTVSVLTDEISQDFGHACEVASRDFGMGLVDLREAGGKNLMNWDAAQIADVRSLGASSSASRAREPVSRRMAAHKGAVRPCATSSEQIQVWRSRSC